MLKISREANRLQLPQLLLTNKKKSMEAVISADIIGYTKLGEEQQNVVLIEIKKLFESIEGVRDNLENNFKIYRGDSVQVEIKNPKEALKIGLLLKAAVTQITFETDSYKRKRPIIDIRMAIGLGNITNKRSLVDESMGRAYSHSGRTLDEMKREKTIFTLKSDTIALDEELNVAFKLLDEILLSWNITSAELMYCLLMGMTEKEIAYKLNISQSAVNQRKKRAGWYGIEALLERYEILIGREL